MENNENTQVRFLTWKQARYFWKLLAGRSFSDEERENLWNQVVNSNFSRVEVSNIIEQLIDRVGVKTEAPKKASVKSLKPREPEVNSDFLYWQARDRELEEEWERKQDNGCLVS